MPDSFTALIIDDDQEMRQSLCVLLERTGWQARAFSAAQTALALIGGASGALFYVAWLHVEPFQIGRAHV